MIDLVAKPENQEILFSKTFEAPRELVFRAFTDPDLIPRWWAPKDESITVEVLEPRAGGSWRFRNVEADGTEHVFQGVFHTVAGPERIVQTFEYGGMPGHVMLETVILEDLGDGRTRLTDSSVFQSVADRDGMLGSGMDSGATESMQRLEELLRTL